MYEPIDMTIELDGVGRRLSGLGLPAGEGSVKESGPDREPDSESPDGPVFVDESGQRGKKFRRAGWVLTAVCACYAVTLVVLLVGGSSSAPWLQIPGLAPAKEPDRVEIQQPVSSGTATVGVRPNIPAAGPVPTDSNGVVVSRPSSTGVAGTPSKIAPGTTPPVEPSKSPAGGLTTATSPGPPVTSPTPTPTTSVPPVIPSQTAPVTTDPVTPDPPETSTAPAAGQPESQQLAMEGGR